MNNIRILFSILKISVEVGGKVYNMTVSGRLLVFKLCIEIEIEAELIHGLS